MGDLPVDVFINFFYSYRMPYSHRRNYTNKKLDKRIKNIENNLIELKYFDYYNLVNAAVPGVGTIFNQFSLVSSGDGASARTGNVINPTSIQFRLWFIYTQYDCLRYIVFWDRQANGANATLQGTPDSLLDTSTITPTFLAPRNYNTVERFTILMDKYYTPYAPESGTPPDNGYALTETIKLGRKIKFDAEDTTTDITNIVSNCLYFAVISANGSIRLNNFSARLYYRDA